MKVLILAIFVVLAAVNGENSMPEFTKNAVPFEEHPKMQEIMKQQHPEYFNDDGTIKKAPHIVGGNNAVNGQFPHQALIYLVVSDSEIYICGGTVVRHNWILTAAHCVYPTFRSVEIFLGVIDSVNGPYQYTASVTSRNDVKIHSGYNDQTLLNDIALIRMSQAPANLLQTYSYINNITMPLDHVNTNLVGQLATVSGFGRYSDTSLLTSQFLKYISMTVSETSVCSVYGQDTVRSSIICISTNTTASTCGGDSGGPLTAMLSGNTTIVGVVSFGANLGCQLGYPVGFTRVTSYLGWIQDTINMSPKAVAANALLMIIIQVFLFLRK